jgi:hypothetical protein
VEAARGHVHVGRLLAGHGAALALEVVAIRELSPQETARHVRALLAATSRSTAADKDTTWTNLWRELKEVPSARVVPLPSVHPFVHAAEIDRILIQWGCVSRCSRRG